MSQGSLNPKSMFLGQKVCPVGRHRHESEYRGQGFRNFTSTYHQGMVQYTCFPTRFNGKNDKFQPDAAPGKNLNNKQASNLTRHIADIYPESELLVNVRISDKEGIFGD